MASPPAPTTMAGLLARLLLAAAMTGCEADLTSGRTGPATTIAAASPGVLVDARTVADQKNPMCSAPTPVTVSETVYSPVVTAHGDVTIRDARAVGKGVELLDSEGAVVLGNPHNVGAGFWATWPYDDVRGLQPIDGTPEAFVGMTVHDGESVLAFWLIAFDPNSHLRGLDIDYDGGTGTVETLFVPLDVTYGRNLKDC